MGPAPLAFAHQVLLLLTMLPPMKTMKAGGKAMTKGAMTKALATEHGLKQKLCSQVIASFVAIAAKEVKSAGVFTVPGVRMMFGKETKVSAKPAKTVVKAFAVAALKKQIQVCNLRPRACVSRG